MFELNIALRYLVPRRKSLSTALISFLSIGVISLVVWLVLVFLSVTSGIENNWLRKLTALHGPIRITPTERYYTSYYYQADSLASLSNYSVKTIGEKAKSPSSDPYNEESDSEIPSFWPSPDRHPDGELRDLVKETLATLDEFKVPYQDYEIGGALLKLSLNRSGATSTLSQMSYLLSLTEQNPMLSSLLIQPSIEDVQALLQNAAQDPPRRAAILEHAEIQELQLTYLPPSFLPPAARWIAFKEIRGPSEVLIPLHKETPCPPGYEQGILERAGTTITWNSSSTSERLQNPRLRLSEPLHLSVTSQDNELALFFVEGMLQQTALRGSLYVEESAILRANIKSSFTSEPRLLPPWIVEINNHCQFPPIAISQPILLPKNYRDMGVRIGDRGSLSFAAHGAAAAQEQRIPLQVAGFYDPGLLSTGGRCLIVPASVTRTIHATSQTFSPDGTPTNGIFIWDHSWDHADALKQSIEQRLDERGLLPFWKVSTYKEFEFAKELLQQFKSDRTLFLLIGLLILIVACCNIISLLILLINDKKREIAILQAMGATKTSMAALFGFCGFTMGALSSILGTLAAIFTLRNLDSIVNFLSFLQGHAAFQPAFFGKTLPNQLSTEALLFVLIATPFLSFLAGLIPALQATRIPTSSALRQE